MIAKINGDRALALARDVLDIEADAVRALRNQLDDGFVEAWRDRLVNIHPTLLPAFPGINAQYQAWDHGVKYTGVTVHLVTAELDNGPIVLQQPVGVHDGDTAETLADRILVQEHRLYPEAIQIVLDGRWRIDGRRFVRDAQSLVPGSH